MYHGRVKKSPTHVVDCILDPVLRIKRAHAVVQRSFFPTVADETVDAVSVLFMDWVNPMLWPLTRWFVAVVKSV